MKPRIRPLALALIRRGDEILVESGRDDVKGVSFTDGSKILYPDGAAELALTASAPSR